MTPAVRVSSPSTGVTVTHDLDPLRRQRAELRESLGALEQALAAPAPGRVAAWAERVHVSLVELSADFRDHVRLTEGPQGLYGSVLHSAPRLAGTVARLTHEHEQLRAVLDDLLAHLEDRPPGVADAEDVAALRRQGTVLLGRLAHHRQRGADLVYEAYEVDIGGET